MTDDYKNDFFLRRLKEIILYVSEMQAFFYFEINTYEEREQKLINAPYFFRVCEDLNDFTKQEDSKILDRKILFYSLIGRFFSSARCIYSIMNDKFNAVLNYSVYVDIEKLEELVYSDLRKEF